jgi:hypothetical protein
MCRRELVVEQRRLVVAAEEEEAIEPREVAVDLLRAHGLLDEVDRGGVGRRGDARRLDTARLLQVQEAVVERVREVGRVRPDSPLPICSFSSTTTRLPARASA